MKLISREIELVSRQKDIASGWGQVGMTYWIIIVVENIINNYGSGSCLDRDLQPKTFRLMLIIINK